MQRVILFAKPPRAGAVKTRLSPPLDPGQARDLYHAFLRDQLAFLAGLADVAQIELCWDGPAERVGEWISPPAGLRVAEQGDGDLGARILRAMRRSAAEGLQGTLALGVDTPTLPRAHVVAAIERLAAGAAAVAAPADDGGYVLIGLRRPLAELFREVPWGESGVMATTRVRAARCGVELVELDPWYDVDDAAALERLRADLARPEHARRAPASARALATLGMLDPGGNDVV